MWDIKPWKLISWGLQQYLGLYMCTWHNEVIWKPWEAQSYKTCLNARLVAGPAIDQKYFHSATHLHRPCTLKIILCGCKQSVMEGLFRLPVNCCNRSQIGKWSSSAEIKELVSHLEVHTKQLEHRRRWSTKQRQLIQLTTRRWRLLPHTGRIY